MALVSARHNQAKECSLPSKDAQAAASSELRWWPLRLVVQDVLPAVAWHPGLQGAGKGSDSTELNQWSSTSLLPHVRLGWQQKWG